MKLTEMLIRHHVDEVNMLLDSASSLSNEQLDREIIADATAIPFDIHAPTLRALLERIVSTQAIWLAAFRGESYDLPKSNSTIRELKEVHAFSGPRLVSFAQEIEAKDLWASEFVDALCEEPVRFEFGAVLAHILVFSAHRRQLAFSALRKLGRKDLGYGDPINWLRGIKGEQQYNPVCD